MNGTPDTVAYLILGLVIGFGIIGTYLASLYFRFNSIKHDVQALHQLED